MTNPLKAFASAVAKLPARITAAVRAPVVYTHVAWTTKPKCPACYADILYDLHSHDYYTCRCGNVLYVEPEVSVRYRVTRCIKCLSCKETAEYLPTLLPPKNCPFCGDPL